MKRFMVMLIKKDWIEIEFNSIHNKIEGKHDFKIYFINI